MNIFEQYGIKEVADVCLYSIELDENDDEVYIPVLYLDTLKVSTVEETAEQVAARGGLGNPELIIWDYGKEITVTLEDALYTPASMGMTWGGKYGTKKHEIRGIFYDTSADNPKETEVPAKIIMSNFSDFSYRKDDKSYAWECEIKMVTDDGLNRGVAKVEARYSEGKKGEQSWMFAGKTGPATNAIHFDNIGSFRVSEESQQNSDSIQDIIYQIDHALNDVKYLDRIEKCKATQTFAIDTDINLKHGNYRYLQKYSDKELTVFIDPKTMQPYEPNTDVFERKNGKVIEGNLRIIKQYEIYYKWTRTKAIDYTSLGHQIIVDAIHFPGTYRLVGETYSRSRKTGKDQRFQFEIPLCKMGTENSFTLQADGDPTTFTMTLKVLRREDGVMMKLTQYDVENAKYDGYLSDSHNIVPIDIIEPELELEDPSLKKRTTWKTTVTSNAIPDTEKLNLSLNQRDYVVGEEVKKDNLDDTLEDNEATVSMTWQAEDTTRKQKYVDDVPQTGKGDIVISVSDPVEKGPKNVTAETDITLDKNE